MDYKRILAAGDIHGIIHRAVRKGNSHYFESGQYVPTKRDIDWAKGMIAFQTEQYTKRVEEEL